MLHVGASFNVRPVTLDSSTFHTRTKPAIYSPIFLSLCLAGLMQTTGVALASDDALFSEVHASTEQSMGRGHSAIWTMPLVATQYQPLQPAAPTTAALKAQSENHFLDALILLDEAEKNGQLGADAKAEINLLRASFLLQGDQPRQAIRNLTPLLSDAHYAADAYALTAMAYLQLGQMQQGLKAAQQGLDLKADILPHLAHSYTLQALGRLEKALQALHAFNATRTSPSAITLAREAELALTLGQTQAAKALAEQAHAEDATNPYVDAVSGLAYLIDGHASEAKAAFEAALKRDPKDAKVLLGLGLSEIKLGNFQAGQEKLLAANERDPGNALILTYLGRSQQNGGQIEAAMANWRKAQQADPKDPIPWLFQAQAQLQANRPQEARESVREAQARTTYRKVYRGEHLLQEDEQLLQANLAEIQRRLGMDSLAFHTLTDTVGEKNAASLRNQADLLQGQRFGESARRSLLLQSLFNEKPGNLPSSLDIYGDDAGLTGAQTPQHGVISVLSPQQASYNNYDELFGQRTTLQADALVGSKNTDGEQIRLGVGNDKLGLSLAGLQFKTDGFAPYDYLQNRVGQAIAQWRPTLTTQVFASYQTFNSKHGETNYAKIIWGWNTAVEDNSYITRLGIRHSLTDNSELRALWSGQNTDQVRNNKNFDNPPNPWSVWSDYSTSNAQSEELQYRRSGSDYAMQWGVLQMRGRLITKDVATGLIFGDETRIGQQVYAAWQQAFNPHWQLDAGLGLGNIEGRDNTGIGNNTKLERWLPKLGAVYAPEPGAHVRFALWDGMGLGENGDASLVPVSLAGILLTRPGDSQLNRMLVHGAALSGDKQLNSAWSLAAETQQRKTDMPTFDTALQQQLLLRMQVDESKLALHWQPQDKPLGVSLAYGDEYFLNDFRFVAKDGVGEQHLRSQQLTMHWFVSSQCTMNWTWSHNLVSGMEQYDLDPITGYPLTRAYQNSFNQLDADISWKFSNSGLLTTGVRNAADTRYKYTEIDKLNPRFSNGRMVYAKLKFAW